MTGGKVLPPEVQQEILAKSDGIPLYIETLTENVLESGLMIEGSDAYTLKGPLKGLPIPDSLQALLMERVDRLGSAQEIVQTGVTANGLCLGAVRAFRVQLLGKSTQFQ